MCKMFCVWLSRYEYEMENFSIYIRAIDDKSHGCTFIFHSPSEISSKSEPSEDWFCVPSPFLIATFFRHELVMAESSGKAMIASQKSW